MEPAEPSVFEFGPFRVDARRRLLEKDGRPVTLPGKAFEILLALLRHSGELVPKETLMREVWPDVAVEENNLTVNVSGLRKALGETVAKPQLIITVPGRGYRFAGEARTSSGTAEPLMAPPPAPGRAARRAPRLAAAVVILAVAAALVAVWMRMKTAEAGRTIAVLPFRVLNESAENEYMGMGSTGALITRLSNLSGITVRPLSTTVRLAEKDPVDSGRAIGADTVLTGTIQVIADRVRITAQMQRVRDRASVWAESFDEPAGNVLALEDSISARVAASVLRSLSAAQQSALRKRSTRSSEAYGDYLRARYYAIRYTEEGFRKALDYLQRAIDSDAGYALAYSGMADAYYDASNLLLPPEEAMPRAKAAAQRAVTLDPALAEAHVSLGLVASKFEWDWATAEKEFQTALALDPNSAAAHQWYGLYRAQLGDTARAVAELRRAQELDPLSSDISSYLAEALYLARRYDEALQQERKTLEFDPGFTPGHVQTCWILAAQGRIDEAVGECRNADEAGSSPWTALALARANALAGNHAAAQRTVDELRQNATQHFVSGYDLAMVYAALGKVDEAFAALDEAWRHRAEWMSYLKVDPQADRLHGDARFQELLRRMGL